MSAGGADTLLIGAGGMDHPEVRDAPHERYGKRVEQALSTALMGVPAELAAQVRRHVRVPTPLHFIRLLRRRRLWFIRPRGRFLAGWHLSEACPGLAQALG